MRIDGSFSYNQFAIGTQNIRAQESGNTQDKASAQVSKAADAFLRKDVYEPMKAQLSVDFGGYDKSGRATGITAKKNVTLENGEGKVSAVSNNFDTEQTKSSSPVAGIVKDLSKVLGTNEEETGIRVKKAGLEVEDLVDSEAIKSLASDQNMMTKLQDFATEERSTLLSESGMTDAELTNFVAEVKKQG